MQVLIKVLCADFGQLGGWVELDNYHSSLHVHPTLSIWEALYIQQNGSLSQDLLVPHQRSFKNIHPFNNNTFTLLISLFFRDLVTNYPIHTDSKWGMIIDSSAMKSNGHLLPSPRQDISTPPRCSEPPMPCWASASKRPKTPRVEPRERVARRREMGRL